MADFPISDVYLLPLNKAGNRLVAARAEDHLLRRFGQAEVVWLQSGQSTDFMLREVADELWTPLAGRVEFTLIDRRESSPSQDRQMNLVLDASDPHSLLVPFGVAYALAAQEDAQLLRLATHADGSHPGDTIIPKSTLLVQVNQA